MCVFVLLNPHDRKESEWIPVCLRPNLEVVSCVLSNLLPLCLEPEMSRTQALTDPPRPLLIGPGKTGDHGHSVGSHGVGKDMNCLSVNCVNTVNYWAKQTVSLRSMGPTNQNKDVWSWTAPDKDLSKIIAIGEKMFTTWFWNKRGVSLFCCNNRIC